MGDATVKATPAGVGEAYTLMGEQLTFKVTQSDNGGAFTIFELVGQPGGGPPLHTHHSSESFQILEGEMEFSTIEDGMLKTLRGGVGDTIFVPSGVMHTFKVIGDAPSRSTVVAVPGKDMEGFFKEAGTLIQPGQSAPAAAPDIPAILAIAARHGLTFPPPPSA